MLLPFGLDMQRAWPVQSQLWLTSPTLKRLTMAGLTCTTVTCTDPPPSSVFVAEYGLSGCDEGKERVRMVSTGSSTHFLFMLLTQRHGWN